MTAPPGTPVFTTMVFGYHVREPHAGFKYDFNIKCNLFTIKNDNNNVTTRYHVQTTIPAVNLRIYKMQPSTLIFRSYRFSETDKISCTI